MKKSIILLTTALAFIFAENVFAERNIFVPDQSKVLFIVGQDIDTIEAYIKENEHIPAGLMTYTSLERLEGLLSPHDGGAGTHHAQYLVDQYPNTIIQIGLYLVGILDRVVQGEYDQNIRELADWMKEANVPIFLRIGYEYDYPDNNYEPAKYIKAYQYIVDKLNDLKVNNVTYVWHSYAGYVSEDRMNWYPGDDYVDWVGISFFDAYNKSNMESIARIAKKKQKPFMIAEATPRGIGTNNGKKSWNMWFKKFFDFIDEHDVKAFCYINSDWESLPMFAGQGWGEARIQINDLLQERWNNEVSHPKYLKSSKNLYKDLQF